MLVTRISLFLQSFYLKGGHLDFSHLTELKNIYINEIYMKKKKYINHQELRIIKLQKKFFLMGFP